MLKNWLVEPGPSKYLAGREWEKTNKKTNKTEYTWKATEMEEDVKYLSDSFVTPD